MSKLTVGSGNLVRQFDMMRELGGRVTKALPAALIEAAHVGDSAVLVAEEVEAGTEPPDASAVPAATK
jgi:hypothetical protein